VTISRWGIRVTFADGRDAWLRTGATPGEGHVVRFHSKADADRQAAFMREGMSEGDVVSVVRYEAADQEARNV
jgi:hypothetical protein